MGAITVVAGITASTGYSGDGGPATNVQLNNPSSVTLDKDENLYIVDTANYRVRRVDRNGIITTVAGNGGQGLSGENILAVKSPLSGPYGVAFDPHLYYHGSTHGSGICLSVRPCAAVWLTL